MEITKNNVGDILCRYKDGKRFMITDVGDKVIKFMSESWSEPYITDERNFNGVIDVAEDAELSFLTNLNCTKVLDYAEISALRKAFSESPEQVSEGEYMLVTIAKQRESFMEYINQCADERREYLYDYLAKDFDKLNPNNKLSFFGCIIEKPQIGDGIVIDGKYFEKNMAEKILKKQAIGNIKDYSFNELLNSASVRSGKKDNENKKDIPSLSEPEIN